MKSKMKVLLVSAFVVLIAVFNFPTVEAQTDFGGICCDGSLHCEHPIGHTFEDAKWVSGASNCNGHEKPTLGG